MPIEYNREGIKGAADNTRQQPKDLVRLAKKKRLDALPSFHEASQYLSHIETIEARDKADDKEQVMELVSREDQLIGGFLDAIRSKQLNPSLAEALQAQWEKQKTALHEEMDTRDKPGEADRLEHINPASEGQELSTDAGQVKKGTDSSSKQTNKSLLGKPHEEINEILTGAISQWQATLQEGLKYQDTLARISPNELRMQKVIQRRGNLCCEKITRNLEQLTQSSDSSHNNKKIIYDLELDWKWIVDTGIGSAKS